MTNNKDYDDFDFDPDYGEDCANCGGEGYVAHCFEEWACMHPDEGCDLCMRRCDWCNPAPRTKESEALQNVLAESLPKAKDP